MNKSRRQITLLWIVLLLIAVYSAEVFLYAKDADLLEASLQTGLADSLDTYVSLHLMSYALHVLVPLLFAATVFFIPESRWNRVFRGIFSLLLAASALMRLVEWQTHSVFYYLTLAGYLWLLIVFNRTSGPESEA